MGFEEVGKLMATLRKLGLQKQMNATNLVSIFKEIEDLKLFTKRYKNGN